MYAAFTRRSSRSSSSSTSRVSVSGASFRRRAPSVYGGAGGFGTRISEPVFTSGSLTQYSESVSSNEKWTMQNLNDRLANYLETVRTLEASNRKLELQIGEFKNKRAVSVSQDFTGYFAAITKLRAEIMQRHSENQRLILQVDNAQLAIDDFRMKYEIELNMCVMVAADVLRIRGIRDGLTLNISDLEIQIEGLKEELVITQNNQQEDLRQLRIQHTGTVNVGINCPEPVDLCKVLQEMREQYEAVVVKSKKELEKWFLSKVDSLQMQIVTCSQEVKTFETELSEIKRTKQSLEISRQSSFTEIQFLEQNMVEAKSRYSVQLSQLQLTINTLETELQQLRVSVEQQQADYKLLLDIKMRLEMEIAEYRRLLDGQLSVVVTEIVEKEVEEYKPHIERRVKTIVQEVVDGKVVSSTVDTQVEEIHQLTSGATKHLI
ncbi:keratin, type I cytoskeletal 20-like [Cyclopterus lumpus]|nr:keratin, type I cytoskeletal 20-like [Cyclopterus lumpus]